MGAQSRASLNRANRIVVKVGTAVVTHRDGRIAVGRLGQLVEQLRQLHDDGRQVILVTSGAVGLGAERLGLSARPLSVVDRQACAAAGQGSLLAFYDGLFRRAGLTAAQVLLTDEDFHQRGRYVNLAAALERLLELGSVPIINENDSVSTHELVFSDNDRLAALVAAGLGADLVVLLTNVDAVYSKPPGDPDAQRISVFADDADVVLGDTSAGGTGGMLAKIASARLATGAGVPAVVASGFDDGVLARILAGEDIGTFFAPGADGFDMRKRWLAFATSPRARLKVNAGAHNALVSRNASLLPPGVIAIEGEFESGDVVSVAADDGGEFARGIVTCSSGEARAWAPDGKKSKPLIHRDHLVIL